MGWSESQILELEQEVDFFAALVEGSPNPPRPPDHVLEHVRTMLKGSEERAQEARAMTGLDPRQMAVRDEFLDGWQRVRRTIDQLADGLPQSGAKLRAIDLTP